MAAATLVIKILTDTAAATKGMDAAEKSTGRMAKTIGGVAGAVGAGLVVSKVIDFAKQTGAAASAVEQSMGGVESVFGKSAGTIKRWAEGASQSVGLSKSAYGDLASVIGSQLKNLGLPMDDVVDKTNDLIKMGADLAATYGGTTAQAVEALSSALRGETDPIEKYGIAVKQSDIAAQQAADGTDKLTGAAGKAAKTNALLALVSKQGASAMGAFGREADTAAGQQQRATAEWENAQAALGTALLPAMAALAQIFGTLSKLIAEHKILFMGLVVVVGLIAAAMATLSAVTTVTTAVTTIFGAAAAAAWMAALGPIALVIAAVIAVIAIIVLLWNKFPPFKAAVIAVWNGIRAAAVMVANVVRSVWNAVWPPLRSGINAVGAVFRAVFGLIAAVARLNAAIIGLVFRAAFAVLSAVGRPVVAAIGAAFNAVKGPIMAVANLLRGPLGSAFSALGSMARSAGSVISGAFNGLLGIIHTITGAVNSLISAISRIKIPKISIPGIGGKSAPSPAAVTNSPTVAGRLGGTPTATASSSSGGAVVININGAIDPESTARQIRRILDAHNRRQGLTGVLRPAGVV